ncbi:protocatechuate 3,4-dioxygenase subunit beta [Undibacterium sp. RTI2.1]|uniref:protocatechuate 3,4-dioxygenase subunit beta n=1 Tax=unclassified Undibacterium TaxID=2630295 RepID=UPI002AB3BEF5|nr:MULTISPECIES: protocatechuate 3,4-dioxygenase subunit beta [unclassified Undibacterium]MDY7540236.1 protocatechuate 3,4-dioxygenase subunit beta [Undibacterium sp. 5I1]MEB0031099.1 protocatechuate 3,4-dioxygenase subunit beta [Undibacterium sp. RTI2.1]MEB0115309.1 protocatechuate 3,4-dioxygenase subunit beta [Undibacterium sp. RTI2.2]MEB0231408.1 protocatechuate 3,4-dioxygenase subunit beta [Undibacterium sp. 10I3]MEB0257163.1 protocatechuate 3,4-dioxygenase subunit beta [Undibacterium sp. 
MKFDSVEPGLYPTLIYPSYKSTIKRGPTQVALRIVAAEPVETNITASRSLILPNDMDLTAHGQSQPLGEKIVVTGRVLDEDGKPVRNSLLEVWQCNAAGRYWHKRDQHDAPLDPNFYGFGKMLTDDDGRYRFVTIKPGPYPWGNHHKAWRPAHIHFSLFGNVYAQRLVTQMYFPSDPLFDYDPIFQSIPDLAARQRLIARFSMDETVDDKMLGYEFDIVLRGRDATPMDL